MDITAYFKKGYKTTEFWLTIAGSVIVLVNSVTGLDLDAASIVAMLGSIAAYVASRSYLKGHRVEAVALASDLPEAEVHTPPVG